MSVVKDVFGGLMGIFSPPKAAAAPVVPQAPPPPTIDPNANAAAAEAGNKARVAATPDQTTFAGELGGSDKDQKKKKFLGF
ncbi:MAG: hypothetical protein AAB973_00310 [Patescibacteria group bacterium]